MNSEANPAGVPEEKPQMFAAYMYKGDIFMGEDYPEAMSNLEAVHGPLGKADTMEQRETKGFAAVVGEEKTFFPSPQVAMDYARKHNLVIEEPHNFGELTPAQIKR